MELLEGVSDTEGSQGTFISKNGRPASTGARFWKSATAQLRPNRAKIFYGFPPPRTPPPFQVRSLRSGCRRCSGPTVRLEIIISFASRNPPAPEQRSDPVALPPPGPSPLSIMFFYLLKTLKSISSVYIFYLLKILESISSVPVIFRVEMKR